ncbi:plasmid replication initiator TrfA [Hydrogenophaga defluvii]|uniref:Plasmid replication initiator TrfA n=1 Tax=Hydrogenophaga defluvii TaxID=249410 RepID=A0ABW2SGP5_9BURK
MTPMSSRHSSTVTVSQEQLPIWPNDLRGLPNAFARSALFNVANARKGARTNLKRHKVAALQGTSIDYTGEELRQDDEDCFLQILHLARMQEIGSEVRFTAYAMITELGWTRNSGSYQRLVDCLNRLNATAVAVTVTREGGAVVENYTGSLIRSFRWREANGDAPLREWTVLLEREIIALFGPQSYTRLDWKMRMRLAPMEKWLHSFYHTHRHPLKISVATLHRLSGSEIPEKEMRKFRYKLKKALATLVEQGFFIKAYIDPAADLVVVQRNLTHQSIVER